MLVPQTPGGPGPGVIDWDVAGTELGPRPSVDPPAPPIGPTGPFDPRGAFQVPNNFWGFVMLMMGLKS